MNFTDIISPILQHARRKPDHPAFVFGDQVVTYGDLINDARHIAAALLDTGIKKGDRIAVLSPNRPEIFSFYLGMTMIGVAIVPINDEFASHEIQYVLNHSQARVVIRTANLSDVVAQSVEKLDQISILKDFDELLVEAKAFEPYGGLPVGSGRDLVLLCFTSGTTSTPKGVAATHTNELASGFAYSGMWAMTPDDRVLVTLPLSFSFGFHAACYVALISGATVLLTSRFHPRLALEAIETLRPSVFLGVPTMYAMMVDVARKKEGGRYDVSSLRLAAASGAALNEQVIADCQHYLGLTVRPYYAMTEVRPIFSFDLRRETLPPAGSVGQLISPTEVRVVDEYGKEVVDGKTGELWARGPSFSGAYYEDPDRTAGVMVDGWFRTGDLAFRDGDGNYFIVGRMGDQIISGGANIAPIEVENVLLSHPAVSAVAVVGSPDPTFGQVVKAAIVKKDPELSEDDVLAYCKGRIADYKIPRVVIFMDELPVGPSGKVLKTALV